MDANATDDMEGDGPLLLLPGLLSDASIFAGLRAEVPETESCADYGACPDLGEMADRVIAAAPPRFGVLGHSMGARVALEVVRRVPDRVTRLALVSTGIHGVQPGEVDKRHALRDLGRRDGIAALVDAWLPPMVALNHLADTELMNRLRAMCIAAGQSRYEAQTAALLARPEVATLLPTIRCPVLVVCGDRDVWSPPGQHRDIADAIDRATLSMIPDAGHMLPAERPAALGAVVRDWIAATASDTDTHRRAR